MVAIVYVKWFFFWFALALAPCRTYFFDYKVSRKWVAWIRIFWRDQDFLKTRNDDVKEIVLVFSCLNNNHLMNYLRQLSGQIQLFLTHIVPFCIVLTTHDLIKPHVQINEAPICKWGWYIENLSAIDENIWMNIMQMTVKGKSIHQWQWCWD